MGPGPRCFTTISTSVAQQHRLELVACPQPSSQRVSPGSGQIPNRFVPLIVRIPDHVDR